MFFVTVDEELMWWRGAGIFGECGSLFIDSCEPNLLVPDEYQIMQAAPRSLGHGVVDQRIFWTGI